MTPPLSQVERRLLDELLAFHAAVRAGTPLPAGTPVRAGASPYRDAVSAPRFRQPRRRSHIAQNAVVLVALACVALLLIVRATGFGSGSALAATPRPLHYISPGPGAPSGQEVLRRLAAAAAHQPARPPSRRATYAYVKTAGWYLDLSVGSGVVKSSVFPQTTQSWLRPDGSGRIVTVTGGAQANVDSFTVHRDPRLFDLSTDPHILARQLAVGHPLSDGPQEQLVAFTDTASQQPIRPAVEATILRLLAKIPGLINSGMVRDRAGRIGVAVSLDSASFRDRYTLILDPRTGRLLGFEQTLRGSPGRIPVRRGAVLAYTTIYSSGYVTNTTNTP